MTCSPDSADGRAGRGRQACAWRGRPTYAHLIQTGAKRVENRGWAATHATGKPLAIHAGKAKRYGGCTVEELAREYRIKPASMTFGAVVAVARLAACLPIMAIRDGRYDERYPWLNDHDHTGGPWCWVLEDVVALPAPVPCGGAMGLWDWTPPPEVEALLREKGLASRER